MNQEIERRIRSKIFDIQIFLTSDTVTEADLLEIDVKLDAALEIAIRSKAGGSKCEA